MRGWCAAPLLPWLIAGCAAVPVTPMVFAPAVAPQAPAPTAPAATGVATATSSASSSAVAAPRGPEVPRYVLVRPGAFFHTALPPAGQRARDARAGAGADSGAGNSAAQAAARFRLTRAVGEWTEVETIVTDPGDPHCQRPSTLFEGLALRLFVATGDLQPVTVRRVHAAFDGGAVDLEPGVPLAHQGDGWIAFPDGNAVAVELPAAAGGTSYAAAIPRAIAAPETGVPPEVVRTGCASYTGTGASTAIRRAQPPATPAWPADRRGRGRFAARPGAVILLEDGTPVGRTVGEVAIGDDANPDRQRPCFDWPLAPRGAAPESAFRFCVAREDLVESPAFLSDQQVAVVTPRTRRQVALRIDNRTPRPNAEIDSATRTAARRRLFALGDVVLVPPGEDEAMSASRATRNGLTRYVVKISLEETAGAPGEMSSRRIETTLVRGDGTTDGRVVKTGEMQQFQSAGGAADEANALEAMLDDAMTAVADVLRQQER